MTMIMIEMTKIVSELNLSNIALPVAFCPAADASSSFEHPKLQSESASAS